MRNPVGPLPSSIYWRRRVVVVCLLALVAALVVWALNSGGGSRGTSSGAPTGSRTPVATITPGPVPSGTRISGRPGGRDTAPGGDGSSNGGSDEGASGAAGDSTAGDTSAGDTGGSAGSTGTGGAAGSTTGGSGAASTTGGPVPVGSSLPDCAAGSVQLSLTSVQNSYEPGQTPAFRLRATNSGGVTCKMDFGPRSAVFTITKAADTSHEWASDDCPTTGSSLMQVPAHGSTTYTLRWNGKNSSPKCGSPKGQQAQPGTYLVQAKLPGHAALQASFVLAAD
jgi:hypothetical protein